MYTYKLYILGYNIGKVCFLYLGIRSLIDLYVLGKFQKV